MIDELNNHQFAAIACMLHVCMQQHIPRHVRASCMLSLLLFPVLYATYVDVHCAVMCSQVPGCVSTVAFRVFMCPLFVARVSSPTQRRRCLKLYFNQLVHYEPVGGWRRPSHLRGQAGVSVSTPGAVRHGSLASTF